MGLFNKKKETNKNKQNQTFKKIGLNELNEDVLSNISGGQSYSETEQQANENYIKSITQSP